VGILLEYCGAAVIATLCVSQGFFALLAIVSLEGSVVHRAAFNSPVTTFEVALGFAAFAAADVALVLLVDRLKKVGGASALPRATDASSSRSFAGRRRAVRPGLLHSVALGATGLLLQLSGLFLVDALGCVLVVVLVAPRLMATFTHTAPLLLQKAPTGPRAAFDKGCREVSTFESVVECYDEYVWVNSPGQLVGALKVKLDAAGFDPRDALTRIRTRFAGAPPLTVPSASEATVVG